MLRGNTTQEKEDHEEWNKRITGKYAEEDDFSSYLYLAFSLPVRSTYVFQTILNKIRGKGVALFVTLQIISAAKPYFILLSLLMFLLLFLNNFRFVSAATTSSNVLIVSPLKKGMYPTPSYQVYLKSKTDYSFWIYWIPSLVKQD